MPADVNGKRVAITPGMMVDANIIIGNRRVIEHVLSPVLRYSNEGGKAVTDCGSDNEKPQMPGDLVLLSYGRSFPRELYIRWKRIFSLFWIAAFSPLALLIAGALTPDTVLIRAAKLFDSLFWAHFKQVSIEGCAEKCHMMAYGLVSTPVSWLATIVVALWAIPLTVQNQQARQEAFRRGAAPFGRAADGKVNPPPGLGITFGFGIVCVVVSGAVLFGMLLILYSFGGSDHTVSRGRQISPAAMSFLATLVMGVAQFLAAALMFFLTVVALGFKKLLNW